MRAIPIRNVVNADDVEEIATDNFPGWRSFRKSLSPAMPEGRIGARITRVPSGQSACPFHTHQIDDEIFFVLSGRGILRYGEKLTEIGALCGRSYPAPGCQSCDDPDTCKPLVGR